MNLRWVFTVALFVVILPQPVFGGVLDNSLFAVVLSRHLDKGMVDYAGLKADRQPLDTYLDAMGRIDPASLSINDRLAFYINLYNATTLRLIIDHYPVESIKDIGSFFSSPWKKDVVVLNGQQATLDHIEHNIIRPLFKEARVHFALNCTAMSCPPLLPEPYEGDKLEEQLQHMAVAYINDGKNNYLEGKTLYVSKIFDWFSEDFPDDFVSWFSQFAEGDLRDGLNKVKAQGVKPKVKFLKYDWSLNDQAR
jgi:hypothetical protein